MIPTTVKAGIAAALALAAAPHITEPGAAHSTPARFIAALVTQALVGLHARDVHDAARERAPGRRASSSTSSPASRSSAIYDPFNNAQAAIFGRFYELLATTLLFTTNAYLILVNGCFRSFEVVPAGGLGKPFYGFAAGAVSIDLIVQAFKIPSGSMIPTLQIGDHILVNKLAYGVRIPFLER